MFAPVTRVVSIGLVILIGATIVAISFRSVKDLKTTRSADSGVVVHEWGTFTSVAGRNGGPREWRPLTFESDLPAFVYSIDKGASWRGFRYPSKSSSAVTVRMETPVIYFYTQEETEVALRVGFPNGRITEWYPRANVSGGSIDWQTFKIRPGASRMLPNDARPNHYYPARETDASLLEIGTNEGVEREMFLFYRGVGNFALPLSATIKDQRVLLKNVADDHIGSVILFEKRDGNIGYRILSLFTNQEEFERPALDGSLEALRHDLKALLISGGLYEKEAEAMLNTWHDSWFEEGLRVLYLMPRTTTDKVLPITISPNPTELVRVLVGRTELITPEMEESVTTQLIRLREETEVVRESARKELNKYGRFLEPILMEIMEHARDARIRNDAARLIEEMK